MENEWFCSANAALPLERSWVPTPSLTKFRAWPWEASPLSVFLTLQIHLKKILLPLLLHVVMPVSCFSLSLATLVYGCRISRNNNIFTSPADPDTIRNVMGREDVANLDVCLERESTRDLSDPIGENWLVVTSLKVVPPRVSECFNLGFRKISLNTRSWGSAESYQINYYEK